AFAALEAVVAGTAVQPGGQGDAAGHLDVVVAGQAADDQPVAGVEGAYVDAVDADADLAGAAAWGEDDAVVAGRALDDGISDPLDRRHDGRGAGHGELVGPAAAIDGQGVHPRGQGDRAAVGDDLVAGLSDGVAAGGAVDGDRVGARGAAVGDGDRAVE